MFLSYSGQSLLHILRKWCLQMEFFPGHRMYEGEGKGVKCLTVNYIRYDFRIGFHSRTRSAVQGRTRVAVYAPVFERVSVAVEMVSFDGMTDVCQVDSYLMGSAGFKLQLNQSVCGESFKNFKVSD